MTLFEGICNPIVRIITINSSPVRPEHMILLHSDRHQSNMDPNPTSVGIEESMLNASAEYQEWPISGVFKRVIVGDEVRYGIEFSLEESHSLMCPQHTVAHKLR